MDVDGLPIIGPGVDYTQVNQFKLKLYMPTITPNRCSIIFTKMYTLKVEQFIYLHTIGTQSTLCSFFKCSSYLSDNFY